ncbi:MAG: type II CAAX endopeptidase family protein [Patescibacteria group bacterium]
MAKQDKTKVDTFKNVISLYAILLVVWGFYRIFFKVDDWIEEVVIKPIVWFGPMYYYLRKEGAGFISLGWTARNLFKSIYLALGLGLVFVLAAVFAHLAKYGGRVSFSTFGFDNTLLSTTLLVSFITAIVEETVFRGYILTRLKSVVGEIPAVLASTVMWGVIHLPVDELGLRFFLTSVFGFGSAILFLRTGNIVSSILLGVLWAWPIILFR